MRVTDVLMASYPQSADFGRKNDSVILGLRAGEASAGALCVGRIGSKGAERTGSGRVGLEYRSRDALSRRTRDARRGGRRTRPCVY
jgi:hypothetical protein